MMKEGCKMGNISMPVKKKKRLMDDSKWAWFLLTPNILGFLLFTLVPVAATFILSFTNYDMLTSPKFIALDNYIQLAKDPVVRQVTFNTIIYTIISVPVGMTLALVLAVLLDQEILFKKFYRGAYFLPSIVSMVVVSIVWQWLLNTDYGLINYFLSMFGIKKINWLTSSSTSLISIAIVGIWKRLGYDMVIFLSGLQGISNTYYEASKLDGASTLQQFRYITVPLLKPTTFFVFIMGIISSFQVFDQVMLMTAGGPGRSSSVLVHYLYQNAFVYFDLGYACAIAYLLFAIILIITAINMRAEKRMREVY